MSRSFSLLILLCLFGDHLPEEINNICQTIGIDYKRKGFAQNDNNHIALESHLGQSSQHTKKICGADWPNHHKDEKTIKTIAFIKPANVFVVSSLADNGLNKGWAIDSN